jgi:hypothetical protein
MLQPALKLAVKAVGVRAINADLQRLVPSEALDHLAGLGLRGERVFPTPAVLRQMPTLIAYYRMLLGISRKEFRQPGRLGYGAWETAERVGRLSITLDAQLDEFCGQLILPLTTLVFAMGQFDDRDLNDLALLTLGPTLQGRRLNVIGAKAAVEALSAMRTLVTGPILLESNAMIRFQSPSGLTFEMFAGADPDLVVSEGLSALAIPFLAVEIKGGRDASNAFNRAGEAEKSHIAARRVGYRHRWTIFQLMGIPREQIEAATPSSTEVFDAADVFAQTGPDWERLRQKFAELFARSLSKSRGKLEMRGLKDKLERLTLLTSTTSGPPGWTTPTGGWMRRFSPLMAGRRI